MRRPLNSSKNRIDMVAARVLLQTLGQFIRSYRIEISRAELSRLFQATDAEISAFGKEFRSSINAYEEMGIVLSTWYTDPRFLDKDGNPRPLHISGNRLSVSSLVRASKVKIGAKLAKQLLLESSSVQFDAHGRVAALKRAFVMQNFEVPRAALIILRFLDTLRTNHDLQKIASQAPLLLERCSYVTDVNSKSIAPLMRDIKSRGIAFMDSVDGEIESHRVARGRSHPKGEMGVVAFAWTRAATEGSGRRAAIRQSKHKKNRKPR